MRHTPPPVPVATAVEALLDALVDGDDLVALTREERLVPVDGSEMPVVSPPTYAPASSRESPRYNVDRLDDGTLTAVIDSPQSQANRLEPIFGRGPYRDLVPSRVVRAALQGNDAPTSVDLLDMGHRLADAAIRYSSAGEAVAEAWDAYVRRRDASKLARLGPTSLVYGAWDSRATQAKIPRLLTSSVRAWDVVQLTRSAQYVPAMDYGRIDGLAVPTRAEQEAAEREGKPVNKAHSEVGMAAVPSVGAPGGVLVRGRIVRTVTVNVSAVRNLRADAADDAETRRLRRYVAALALVSATYPLDHDYRSGCQLVPDPAASTPWRLVRRDGTREDLPLPHADVLAAALGAARDFGVADGATYEFDPTLAGSALAEPKKEPRAGAQASGDEAPKGAKGRPRGGRG